MTDIAPPPGARVAPSTARNRDPILDVLKARLPAPGLIVEVASGAGEHAIYIAGALPHLTWQPTDRDDLSSIMAWREAAGLPNVLEPKILDASNPDAWPVAQADAMVCINMIHIAPWRASEGLFTGAGRILKRGGRIFLYGPYKETGVETAPSNEAFDLDLKRRNPEWGLRNLDDVAALAQSHGLKLAERIAMPANNLIVVFEKT